MPTGASGFGAADWLEFWLAALLVAFAFLWTPRLRTHAARFAERTRLVMLVLFAFPIALRLALLPGHPVPVPNIYDEFSHLLVADTLLHFRLANPPHALPAFFETFFVLQQPTYSSIYPPGQGLMLAFGRAVSGLPWAGVLFATGVLCAGTYWMLRAYVAPAWALVGGVLAVLQFGPLCLWANCYWGGALPAAAGCLVFGALPRLAGAWRRGVPARRRDAIVLGIGSGVHLLTRPFESLLLFLAMCLFVAFARSINWRCAVRSVSIAAVVTAPALFLILLQNKQVTGSFLLLPEALSQYQYGVPTTLTIQSPAVPQVALTREQELEYRSQLLMHGSQPDSLGRFLLRLQYRVRNYRFFFLPPLYLALLAFLFTLRTRLHLWAALTLAIFALGTNLFPYLLVHYLATVTCLFVFVAVAGLERIHRMRLGGLCVGADLSRILILLCIAEFALWYGLHLFEGEAPHALLRYETWDVISHRASASRRVAVTRELASIPGKLLVFVRYSPRHVFQEEWVWNAADIDGARAVFARDLGPSENSRLLRYYPSRKVFYLEPDYNPPRLTPAAP
jgi:hypothetical protein